MEKLFKRIGLGCGLLVIFYLLIQYFSLPNELPVVDGLKSIKIVDREGHQISHLLSIRGEYVSWLDLSEIPPLLRKMFVVSEDKRFYFHQGIDFIAVFRSLFNSVYNFKIISGASTIPMQLVRIYWPRLGKFYNKPAQMWQAYIISRQFSKGEILQMYLNLVPFAHQVVGINQGCSYFFDKTCHQLSMAEAASLTVIPRNPAYYTKNIRKLKQARNRLIKRMWSDEAWETIAVDQALNEKIVLIKNKPQQYAQHLIQRVRKELDFSKPSEIKTSIDLSLQKYLQTLLKEKVEATPQLGDSSAILVVENASAEILAYVGGPNFFKSKNGMVDGITALRSPGSALKPFVYTLALENEWTLSSILPDLPVSFKTEKGVFSPNNYGGNFSGPKQLRFALANSMNIPVLYLTSKLGEAQVLKKLRAFGFLNLKKDSDYYGLGLSLGNGEVTLWELVQGYTTLSRKGIYQKIHYYKNQNELESIHNKVTTSSVAYLITDVLSDANARAEEFGRGGPLEFDFQVAVKTGTSSDYRDHLTIGYTHKYTVGIWRGNSDGRPIQRALPAALNTGRIFHSVISYLYKNRHPDSFLKPANIIEKRICSITGLLPGIKTSATRTELFIKGTEPQKRSNIYKTILITDCKGKAKKIPYMKTSRDFKKWNMINNDLSLLFLLKNKCGLKPDRVQFYMDKVLKLDIENNEIPNIIKPANHTTFAIDPTIPLSHQLLKFEFNNINNRKNLSLYVDKTSFKKIRDGQNLFWPLKKGNHTFELKDGNKKIGNVIKILVL